MTAFRNVFMKGSCSVVERMLCMQSVLNSVLGSAAGKKNLGSRGGKDFYLSLWIVLLEEMVPSVVRMLPIEKKKNGL